MNYCKSDGVSHNTATGFLNQADRLIIELRQRRQCSMEECTIPDPGGEKILPHTPSWREAVAPELRLQTIATTLSITHSNEIASAQQ